MHHYHQLSHADGAGTSGGGGSDTRGGGRTGSLMVATAADDGDVVEHIIKGLFLSLMHNKHAYDDVCNFRHIHIQRKRT